MTTRYYKLPGSTEYVTWDYLHNTLGYTTIPTEAIGYKSTINWGMDEGTGYCSTDTGEWFVQGQVGWYSLNHLAWDCDVYPGNATELNVEKSGTESNAASLILDGTTEYWLIESQLNDGWCTRTFWEGEGWAIVEDHTYEFILVDANGRITYGVENLTEIEFTPTGYFTIDEGNEVIFVEQSPFPVVCIDEGTRTPESVAPDASFDTELPYYDSKLYIITTNDGQDETLYGWQAEEGTPVPVVLPTVSDQIWCSFTDRAQSHYKTVSADAVARVYNSSQAFDPFWYDVNLVYAIKRLYYRYSDTSGVEMPMVNDSGYLAAQNTTGSEIQVQGCYFVTCSDSTATVVTVYNSSNVAYNAFKYLSYYYVLDDVQSDWTDDLSSIGYHLPLPTVTLDAGWCSFRPNHSMFPPNDTRQAVVWTGIWSDWPFDATKSYAAWWWRSAFSGNGYYGTVLSDYDGGAHFGITNVLSFTMDNYIESRYATCNSPDAVAIQVLNSSNVAYAAFKYTRGGVDYYYVLDETQTDWTDDLSSIGYHV